MLTESTEKETAYCTDTASASPARERSYSMWFKSCVCRYKSCFWPRESNFELLNDCDDLEAVDLDRVSIGNLEAALLEQVATIKVPSNATRCPAATIDHAAFVKALPQRPANAGLPTSEAAHSDRLYDFYPRFTIEEEQV